MGYFQRLLLSAVLTDDVEQYIYVFVLKWEPLKMENTLSNVLKRQFNFREEHVIRLNVEIAVLSSVTTVVHANITFAKA